LVSLSNKRVLITGASGFTGIHLIKRLRSLGAEVIGLVGQQSLDATSHFVDLRDKAKLSEIIKKFAPEYVIHLAAISFVGHDNDLEFYDVNVIGTNNLLKSICDSGKPQPRVLIASSANVYGSLEKKGISECDSCEPVNHYAISKLAMEKLVATFYSELEIIVTRPFNYTGVFQAEHFLVPKIVNHFKEKASVIQLGNIDVARDYSSVDFLVEAYIRLIQSDVSSEIVNVCSGRLISLKDIINSMSDISGHQIKVQVNQEFVRKNDIKIMSGDNTKLFQLVGEIPIKPFEEVLSNMYTFD
jgi:nucleoside-diphosphate-sugar epimerase